ncbi:MFS transporter [Nitrosophilus alvini]|uniref:MFS transporter n=1 Tax=Nitrosophilus alvini TaxID=2714855 RepID=UPI00190C15FB|nr:MFS transporter [Nitrosophilus alvini]
MNKNIVYLGIVSFFTDMATAMTVPLIPIYIVYALHEGVDKVGIIASLSAFVSYGLRFFSGYISDRYGIVKPLVVTGYLFSAFSKPLLAFTADWRGVALLRSLERFGKALRSAPKDMMISYYSSKNREGKSFGFHKTLDIAGEMSGNIILFALLYYFGSSKEIIQNIFISTAIPGVIAVIIMIFFVRDIKKEKKKIRFTLRDKEKKILKVLGFYFAFIFFIFSQPFFILRAKEAGFSTHTIPLLMILFTLVQTLTSYKLGILTDKIGAKKILFMSMGAGFLAVLSLIDKSTVWFAFLFFGIFMVGSLNALRAYISKESVNQGTVYGIFYTFNAITASLGALVSGYLWEHLGFNAALLFSSTGMAVVLLFYAAKTLPDIKNG